MATKYTLNGSGQATPWMDLRDIVESFEFNVAIGGSLTAALEISNDVAVQADPIVIESYVASVAKVANKPFPRLFRIRLTSFASGSAIVTIGRSVDGVGNPVDIHELGAQSSPSNNF